MMVTTSAAAPGQTPSAPAVSEVDKEQARRLVALGDERFAAGDYRGALDAYAGADLLVKAPTTGLQVARARVALGQLMEARAGLQRMLSQPKGDEPDAFRAARANARLLDRELEERIPTFEVQLTGHRGKRRASLAVNGVTWAEGRTGHAYPTNPGRHRISLQVEGSAEVVRSFELRERDHKVVELVYPSPDTPRRAASSGASTSPLVYLGFGLAGVATVVGAITGGVSLARAAEVDDACSGDVCPTSVESTQEESLLLAHLSTASFIVAGVGVGLGVVGIALSSPGAEPNTAGSSHQLLVGPGRLDWRLRF